jgi:F420-dependent oxidoreductase-like protein
MAIRRVTRRKFLTDVGAAAMATALAGRVAERRAHAAPRTGKPRFGVQTHPQHVAYADIVRVWEDADELGLDTAFVFDHFVPIRSDPSGPCLEGWTLVSALAAKTKRVRPGVLVTGNTYRHPAVLAKMAATVDQVSGGRLILGMGAGWFELEHTAYGIPFHTAGGRARRLVEAVEVVKRLFTQDQTSFAGKYYQLKDAPFLPKGVQRPYPPILIGGMGPKVVQPLAARHADIWHFFAPEDVDETRRTIARFDDLVRQAGREPAAVEKAISLRPDELTGKEAKAVRARIAALAEAGVGHFILSLSPPFDRDLLRRFAKEIVPGARAG